MATRAVSVRQVPSRNLDQVLAEIRALDQKLDHIIALLERGRGPRDAVDRDLVTAIVAVLETRPFTSAHVLQLAAAHVELQTALVNADITNARELGQLLARVEGMSIHGFQIVRMKDDPRGIVWLCRLSS